MKLGFIILAHENLHRVAQLAKYFAKHDCPVSLHIDRKVSHQDMDDFKSSLAHLKNIVYPKRENCVWGRFSIVEATLNATEALFEAYPQTTNVFLISGSCLPTRPVSQLKAYLSRHEDIDFIESVPIKEQNWVKDGLQEERFTLYFPFSWKQHKFIFDQFVHLQRFLKVKRSIPEHISLHMGSQWWCLTTKTLKKILDDPMRQINDRFFSKSWIPDEAYFQSLARLHSKHIRSQPLTFSMFDMQGKPLLFYDDHLNWLPKTSAFFVRKIWPGASKLYRELLSEKRKNFPLSKANDQAFISMFATANKISRNGIAGRVLQGRFPRKSPEKLSLSTQNFAVFWGLGFLFSHFQKWARNSADFDIHGNLFAKKHFKFHGGKTLIKGNLLANTRIRNTHPKNYLSNVLSSQGSKRFPAFLFDATDIQKIMPDIAADKNARVIVVKEAWLFLVARREMKFKDKIKYASILQKREEAFLNKLNESDFENYEVFSLNEALKAPGRLLQSIVKSTNPDAVIKPIETPQIADTSLLHQTVYKLKKNGVHLSYKPKKKKDKGSGHVERQVGRPYVVR